MTLEVLRTAAEICLALHSPTPALCMAHFAECATAKYQQVLMKNIEVLKSLSRDEIYSIGMEECLKK